jgi:ketosteroid isomerase-like protein
MAGRDWDAMAACLSDDVERVGPYGDTYRGRTDYVAFIAGLIPTLPGYRMEVHRVLADARGRTAVAELSETVEVDGQPVLTPESLVFDLDAEGRICHIAVYIQRPP